MTITVGSLFAGIGGFDLGLERAGYEIKWQVEIDPYCTRVLAKHWPSVTRYGDIRAIDWTTVDAIDLLCGGFPCQDISYAGKGAGLAGARSGLWSEYVRAIASLTPKAVLIENVAALRTRGLDHVLGELATLGYDAEWHCIPAYAVGAPHKRDRVWIMGFAHGHRWQARLAAESPTRHGSPALAASGDAQSMADTKCSGPQGHRSECQLGEGRQEVQTRGSGDAANPVFQQRHRWSDGVGWWEREPQETLRALGERGRQEDGLSIPESVLGRVAYGVPNRVDRLKSLGNAVVPQIVEALGRMIIINWPNTEGI